MNPDYFEVRLNRLLIFCWILKWKHNGCKAMKSYIDTVDDIKVTAITGLTNSNGINWGWLKISLKFIWASLFKLDLRLFNHFLQSIFHDFMVAEVVADLAACPSVPTNRWRNRNWRATTWYGFTWPTKRLPSSLTNRRFQTSKENISAWTTSNGSIFANSSKLKDFLRMCW